MIAQLLENVKNPVVSNKLSKWLSKKMAITDLHRKLGAMSGLSNWSFYWMLIHILHHIKVVHQSSKKNLLRRFQVPQKMSRKLPFAKWREKSLNIELFYVQELTMKRCRLTWCLWKKMHNWLAKLGLSCSVISFWFFIYFCF